ncbi:enoyl-CoA hydratase [Cognatiyoonia koreensis]|uniref:3-hydroxyisobutyryl-CoA hydrolase n=1 Tax=Cognatiyoonia koreensis TaxID=364200 RepID=A0A1I0PMU6_9RHOB|nr:enoyl-CoA hydratase/isomerase family protein [Cognatiyoonia koreensis]SEW15686.1 enoyl-CoA hydratase [Cognatiyoonia koreensis]
MSDLLIRQKGRAGWITLNRPQALNALTYDMVLQIEQALDAWREADLACIIIDAAGEKAFCSGGDIADMYASGQRGDLSYGRQFWQDEYRLNAKIAAYPKPIFTFLQGYTMGGGVGVGCHASHRIVGESSQIAMPECSIGLVPDIGGSFLLARAPGFSGTYLGLTGTRMNAADAITATFADHFVPQSDWASLKSQLTTGDLTLPRHAAPGGTLMSLRPHIDAAFHNQTLADILRDLPADTTLNRKALERNAPLAMACAVQIIAKVRQNPSIRTALRLEYRYTYRAVAQGDFIEGIRAAIIDKDRTPHWQHTSPLDVTSAEVDAMISPLSPDQELKL